MVCAEQRSGEGQERLLSGMKNVTVLDGKAGTFLQPSGKFRSIPTIDPVLVGLCNWKKLPILKGKPREINGGIG